MISSATFSPCRLYRYDLWRRWATGPYCMFVGLNPSTADETQDDPTIRRCINYAKGWGYAALCMTNIFAFRATDPYDMMKPENLFDIDNHHYLVSHGSSAGIIIAAWGKHGKFANRDITVKQWFRDAEIKLHCLKQNKDGSPAHPLYLKKDIVPYLLK